MKISIRITSFFLASLAGLALAPAADAKQTLRHRMPRVSIGPDPCPCSQTAAVTLNANTHEAEGDFWLAIAHCLNEPDADFDDCVQQAWSDLQAALDLAQQQYQARLDACAMLGCDAYDPQLDPAEFSADITNSLLPFTPGVTLEYKQVNGDGTTIVEVRTLHDVVDIDGFPCRTIDDRVTLNGTLIEDATDYVSQRSNGEVWYMGEVSRSYVDGFLDSLDGSWRNGKDDAKPGILMQASFTVGQVYRQEYLINEAEDLAQILATDVTVTVPYGTLPHCLQTLEWSPQEPGAFETKYYAAGIGLVLTVDQTTGDREELVAIH